jgi:hypothetical protein
MTGNGVRQYGTALALIVMTLVSHPVHADGLCQGSVTGSVLAPLHKPIAASIVTPVGERANPTLTQRFLEGVQAAGVAVVQDGQGNTSLNMTFTVTPPSNGGPGSAAGTYKGFGWMSGETIPGGAGSSMRGSILALTVEATNTATQSLAWVGTFQCTIRSDDAASLAEDLGRVVGRSLGNSISERSF